MFVCVFFHFANLLSEKKKKSLVKVGGAMPEKGTRGRGGGAPGLAFPLLSALHKHQPLIRGLTVMRKVHSDLRMIQGKCYPKSNNSFQRCGSSF